MGKLFMIFGVIALFIGLAACGGGGQDPAVVGRWEMLMLNPDLRYVFNADGTGDRGIEGVYIETFIWSTAAGSLEIRRDGVMGAEANERWTYDIYGETLTLINQRDAGMIEVLEKYVEGGQNADVIGTWAPQLMPEWHYNFVADGTGDISISADVFDTFTWATHGDFLHINRDGAGPGETANERWIYSVDGDVLNIQSRTHIGLDLDMLRARP